ncbi:FUSC family protein [Pseudoxanthobacter sp.]|uniref:FUSC family protein n=1 Tax=Pseudoxanthobacter sp. TaxID=1925742 RepID=UPI002FE34504
MGKPLLSLLDRLRHPGRLPASLQVQIVPALRAGIAGVLPILAGELMGEPLVAGIGVVGFLGCLIDPGGEPQVRLKAMMSFAVLVAAVCLLAWAGSQWLPLGIGLAVVCGFAFSYVMVLGAAATAVGLMLTVELVVFLGQPLPGAGMVLLGAFFAFLGGLWAVVLTLVIWPNGGDTPARGALAESWRALAGLAERMKSLHDAPPRPGGWERIAPEGWAPVRATLETTRSRLAAVRRTRGGTSARSRRVLLLLSDAETVFRLLCALCGSLEAIDRSGAAPARAAAGAFSNALRDIAESCRIIAGLLDAPPRDLAGARSRAALLTAALAGLDRSIGALGHAGATPDGPVAQAALVMREAALCLADAGRTTPAGHSADALADVIWAPADPLGLTAIGETLKSNFTIRSVAFRHAVRVALGAGLSVGLSQSSALDHGYWMSVTTVIILQPYTATTWRRMLDRVAGTVAGSVAAALLLAVLNTPLEIAVLIFPFLVVAMLLRAVGYAFYVLAMTVAFLLIADLFAANGLAPWSLSWLRIESSFLGAALALVLCFSLWPNWEARGLPNAIAASLMAARDFITAALARPDGAALDARTRGGLQRACGLANNNAETALQRLINEPRIVPSPAVEPALAAISAARRLSGLAIEIDALPAAAFAGPQNAAVAASAARWADEALAGLAASLAGQGSSGALPPLPQDVVAACRHAAADVAQAGAPGLLFAALERMERQVSAIAGGAGDLLAALPAAAPATPAARSPA